MRRGAWRIRECICCALYAPSMHHTADALMLVMMVEARHHRECEVSERVENAHTLCRDIMQFCRFVAVISHILIDLWADACVNRNTHG